MKLFLLFSLITFTSTSFAKTAAQCSGTAKGAAEDYMGQILDQACAGAKASVINSTISNGQITYEIDVVCGPASIQSNHHSHEVILDKNDCNVIGGGGGDA